MQNIINYKTIALIMLLSSSCLVAFKPAKQNAEKKAQSFNLIVQYDTTAFANAKDTILHMPTSQLIWADFKGQPVISDESVANSSVGFKYDAEIAQSNEHITVFINVSAFFIKATSWKKTTLVNDYILQHEQRHFDLARYGAQLFVNEIASKKMNIDNFNKILQTAYADSWKKYIDLQRQYDKESNHSINEPQQKQWNQTIENFLRLCN